MSDGWVTSSALRDEIIFAGLGEQVGCRGLALESELSSLIEGAVRAAPVGDRLGQSERIREWEAGDVLLDEGGSESGGESGELWIEMSDELALVRPGTKLVFESGKDKYELKRGERC